MSQADAATLPCHAALHIVHNNFISSKKDQNVECDHTTLLQKICRLTQIIQQCYFNYVCENIMKSPSSTCAHKSIQEEDVRHFVAANPFFKHPTERYVTFQYPRKESVLV